MLMPSQVLSGAERPAVPNDNSVPRSAGPSRAPAFVTTQAKDATVGAAQSVAAMPMKASPAAISTQVPATTKASSVRTPRR
jgi:hypothetical protein